MLLLSIAVFLVVPDVKQCDEDFSRDDSKNLNIRGILKVVRTKIMALLKYQLTSVNVSKYITISVLYFSRHV